jgi:hypothetical protein
MEGKQGRLLPFAFTAGQWNLRSPGSRLRGVPRVILPAGERWAVLAERKGAFTLYLVDPSLETRPLERPLPGRPTGLARSTDGSTLMVALGREVRTFTLDPFRSSVAFLFDQPIDHLAGRPGVDRLLVARGWHLTAVDPGDTPTRGTLPVRAETDLPGMILDIAWTGRGEMALALVDTPPAVLYLSGEDLSLLERHDLNAPARALAADDAGRALVLMTNGTLAEIPLQEETRELARAPEPSPPPDPGRDRTRVAPDPEPPDPPPATPELQRKRRVPPPVEERPLEPGPEPSPPVTRVPKTPLPTTPPSVSPEEPVPATPPTAAPRPVPREEPAPAPAPPAVPAPEAPPPAASPLEPRTEPVPAAEPVHEEVPTESAPVAPPPAAPEQPPVASEPETGPVDAAPEPEESPPETAAPSPAVPPAPTIPEQPAGGAPSPPAGSTLPDGPPAGGTVTGRLTGQPSLVAEVVLLGPNNLLREAARVPPRPTSGDREATAFLVGDLAPGRYRVVPMGPDGSSLACRPPFATVTVTRERGARADFAVIGRR